MKSNTIFWTLSGILMMLLLSSFVGVAAIDSGQGIISFIGNAGSDNEFIINQWKITHLDQTQGITNIELEAELNMSSISASWKDLEKNVKRKKEYLFIKKFPKAYVSIKEAELMENGKYRTIANLTLKGITKEVPLEFEMESGRAIGMGIIMRSDFQVNGDGPKEEVPVKFDIVLDRG